MQGFKSLDMENQPKESPFDGLGTLVARENKSGTLAKI